MTREEIIYLAPYLGSLFASLVILIWVWEKRKAKGAGALCLYILGQFTWLAGFILELISNDVTMKILWDGLEWMSAHLILIITPVFAVHFTEFRVRHAHKWFKASLIVPGIFTILLLTENFHNLIYQNVSFLPPDPFSEMVYSLTPAIIFYVIYGYAVFGWSIYILARRLIRPHGLYRGQLIMVMLGLSFPVFGTVLSLFGVQITPERDAIPLTSILTCVVTAFGLFYFRIFDIAPIGRDRVFESLVDPVVILDSQNRVIDINASMLALMDKNPNQVIGEPAKKVFDDFPIPIKLYTHVSYARTETSFKINNREIHYELTVWPLYGASREMVGRIYLSHDITALKELEGELRNLNTQLEDRVQARTRDLAEAYESMLEGLARALELRDKETEGHSRRVTEMTIKLAQKMGVSGDTLEDIRSGAILHDIGKISIPDEILHKQGKLTQEERVIIEQHPETAFKLLSRIPFLSKAIEIPYCHHEKWDGTGYPRKLKGDEIPLSARIFAVADVWDALSNNRPYNKAWPREQIIEYFNEQTGKHFDPAVVKLFLSMVEKGEI